MLPPIPQYVYIILIRRTFFVIKLLHLASCECAAFGGFLFNGGHAKLSQGQNRWIRFINPVAPSLTVMLIIHKPYIMSNIPCNKCISGRWTINPMCTLLPSPPPWRGSPRFGAALSSYPGSFLLPMLAGGWHCPSPSRGTPSPKPSVFVTVFAVRVAVGKTRIARP